MKRILFLLAIIGTVCTPICGKRLLPLRVKGNQLVDKAGQRVLLHGVMDTPNPYFNSYRWGHGCTDEKAPDCIDYFDKIFAAITDRGQGAYCNVFRLHLDPCWTNDPQLRSDGKAQGEADISRFSVERLRKYMDVVFWPIIRKALNRGLYVVVRPPGVCPHRIEVGGDYQRYLLTVWDVVSRHDSIRAYSGVVSLELANEPVDVTLAGGGRDSTALRDFFQPVLDKVRHNGFKGIVWIPGAGWQSHYEDFARCPLRGKNFGFAVHVYPGWYGASDEHCDHDAFIRQFGAQVPVVRTHPVLVSEIDWSPEVPGKGKTNEFGNYVAANMGSWGTATTSRWGLAFKAVKDFYGNISMNLTSTDDYVDMPEFLRSGTVRPAFGGEPEACGRACFDWYKQAVGGDD